MTDLSEKKCIPCEGGIPGFDITEIHKYLKMVDGWEVKADEFKTMDARLSHDRVFVSVEFPTVRRIDHA